MSANEQCETLVRSASPVKRKPLKLNRLEYEMAVLAPRSQRVGVRQAARKHVAVQVGGTGQDEQVIVGIDAVGIAIHQNGFFQVYPLNPHL